MASQASFDDLLQCSICLERFTQPKALPCLHTFCLSCLRGIVKDEKTVDCPTCRRPHQVPEQGVVGFQDNLMAVNLLSMIGESTECYDCGNKQSLSECEHCQQQVCADCRVAHNILQTDISILIQSLELGVLKNPDDKIVQAAQTSLTKTEQAKIDIDVAFEKAVQFLKDRKEEITQQVGFVAKFQKAVTQGTGEAVVEEIRQELSSCGSKEGLKRMKESLMTAEEMLSGELEFIYDISGVARFGELRCGGETVTKETTTKTDASLAAKKVNVKPKLERKLAAGGDVLGAAAAAAAKPGSVAQGATGGFDNLGFVASGFQAADKFPLRVDYEAKKISWSTIICKYPSREKQTFSPSYAAYSPVEQALYCLSSGKLLKFDVETGGGEIVFEYLNATDLAVSESGTVLVIDNNQIAKIRPAMDEAIVDYDLAPIILRPPCTRALQICCYRNEIMILDSGKKSLLKLDEHGKLVQVIKLDLDVRDASRMCVDREGRIYVTSARITDRKDNEDWYRGCTSCRVSQSVKVSWEVVISILTWDGEESGQLAVDAGSEDYQYKFNHTGSGLFVLCSFCRREYHRKDGSVPSNNQIIYENFIGGLCVDGDGYISVTRPGKNQIDVYDPKHKLFCTIGNKETPEFQAPQGLTLMPDGRLVVCDTGNERIQII